MAPPALDRFFIGNLSQAGILRRMNFYGPETTEQHTLAGRLIPLMEAFNHAILRATNQPEPEQNWSRDLPQWCHNVCDAYAKTVFSGFVKSSVKARKLDPHHLGRMVGMILRLVLFVLNELPVTGFTFLGHLEC